MFLSIIIPSYNEKKNLEILLLKIFKVLKSFKFKSEIILVDDGSTDETRKLFLKNQKYSQIMTLKKVNICVRMRPSLKILWT
jgi:glycosyltransferase involved in cell wall biosynthesis